MKSYDVLDGGMSALAPNIPMPTRWCNDDIELRVKYTPAFIELGELEIESETVSRKFRTYVARYELGGAVVGGVARALSDQGFFLVFYVVEFLGSRANVWTLCQTDSPVFSDRPERGDYVPAGRIGRQARTLVGRLPRWKKDEAVWPTVGGAPMLFTGEVELVDSELNRKFATTGERVYWFFLSSGEVGRFKAITQRTDFQSGEDHYASEAIRKSP